MTFTISTNISEVQRFFKNLATELDRAAHDALKRCGDKAVELSSKAIQFDNPGLVGAYWKPLHPDYLYGSSDEAERKQASAYPTQILKLTGNMMKQFYRTNPNGTLRMGGVSVSISNHAHYFPLMELGGDTDIHYHGRAGETVNVPARPSLLPLAKHRPFLNECVQILSEEIRKALMRSNTG